MATAQDPATAVFDGVAAVAEMVDVATKGRVAIRAIGSLVVLAGFVWLLQWFLNETEPAATNTAGG